MAFAATWAAPHKLFAIRWGGVASPEKSKGTLCSVAPPAVLPGVVRAGW